MNIRLAVPILVNPKTTCSFITAVSASEEDDTVKSRITQELDK